MISVHFQGKPFNITVIQVCAPTTNAEEADQFYEDQEDLLELISKKDVLFIIRDTNVKVKRYLELQASLALENKLKQGKG